MIGQTRVRVAAVAIALALAGCAPSGKVHAPEVKLPAAFELARPTGSELNPVAARWWSVFNDAQLDQLIDEAHAAAPDAKTALARLNAAFAIRSNALLSYNPQGALTAQGADQHTNVTYSGLSLASLGGSTGGTSSLSKLFLPADETKSYQGAFNVSWEVDLFGRRKAARRTANADVLAARFDYEASRLSLEANVATALFQARALAVQLADARETLKISNQIASVGQRKLTHGLASGADAARLDADAASAASEVERLATLSNAARRTLLALIGRGTAPVASVTIEPRLAPPPELPSMAPSDLLRRRPDVREAEQKLRSAVGTLTLSRLALLPTLTLQPGGSLSHSEANYISKTSVWTIAAGATMPILDRPRLIGMVRVQRAKAEESAALYEQSILNAYRDAENGLNQLATDRVRLKLLTEAEAKANFAFKARQKAYEGGLIDLTTLLDAERAWLGARGALTSLQAAALNDAISTVKALGGGWSDPPAGVKG